MDDDKFDHLRSRLMGIEPDALTDAQRRKLIVVLKAGLTDGKASIWCRVGKVVATFAILGAFAWAIWTGPAKPEAATSWMVRMSCFAVGGWIAAFVIWEGWQGLQDNTALGVWLWGGIMMLIAFNFGAVVVFASHCIELGSTSNGIFKTKELLCAEADRQMILRFFLAAKEFGTVLAVALGFASIAWVNFFTRQS